MTMHNEITIPITTCRQKETTSAADFLPTFSPKLYLPEDLINLSGTRAMENDDLYAMHVVAHWIESFVGKPHKKIGRTGAVCPFVPLGPRNKSIWLASEKVAKQEPSEFLRQITRYKKLLLKKQPLDDDSIYKSIIVVLTDVPADEAKAILAQVLEEIAVSTYVEEGQLLGSFYATNDGGALYNSSFRPFRAPVPFLLIR
ncbi:DUF6875 domain-containing protein [Rhizobium grahamii]|uniref:DUF6875 domain-containing protein n=1 Tax=Rhizobium grahamii TaxID=1120045 RepID=A0A370KHQ7_9HYPH|nr:hypothetical protein [Rhizobium grahamii]RDJ05044.1 hypothetical protein B5K06_26065 [Rhizobium grahamii]